MFTLRESIRASLWNLTVLAQGGSGCGCYRVQAHRVLAMHGESMDIEEGTDVKPSDIFYGTFQSHRLDDGSACSSTSFVSASSPE